MAELQGLQPHDEIFDASNHSVSYRPELGVKAGEAEKVLAERLTAANAAKEKELADKNKALADKEAELAELRKQLAAAQAKAGKDK